MNIILVPLTAFFHPSGFLIRPSGRSSNWTQPELLLTEHSFSSVHVPTPLPITSKAFDLIRRFTGYCWISQRPRSITVFCPCCCFQRYCVSAGVWRGLTERWVTPFSGRKSDTEQAFTSDDECWVFTREDGDAVSFSSIIVSASLWGINLSFLWKSSDFQAFVNAVFGLFLRDLSAGFCVRHRKKMSVVFRPLIIGLKLF